MQSIHLQKIRNEFWDTEALFRSINSRTNIISNTLISFFINHHNLSLSTWSSLYRVMPTSFDLYYKAIQGDIMLVGSEPDGDTVRFKPDNMDLFDDINWGHLVKPSNRDGSIRLRLEAIDAPETHYGKYGQKLGVESRDVFLKLLGNTCNFPFTFEE